MASGVRGKTGSTAVPRGSSLTDEASGSNRNAKIVRGSGTFQPGFKHLTDNSDGVASAKIVKMVDPQNGKAPAKVGAGGRYANFHGRTVKANVIRVTPFGPQSGSGNKASRVVRPPKTSVRIGSGGRTHVRNV